MTKDFRRRLYALISSYIILFGCYFSSWHKKDVSYNPNYEYGSVEEFAYYRQGKVFICNEEVIENIRDDDSDNIYIIDDRGGRDPNMRICNSCKELNPIDMYRLLRILIKYEQEYPSDWNRTLISMLIEWLAHNTGYIFDVETYRTADVDLNNGDENKYLILKK